MLQELHAVVSRHVDSIELHQADVGRLESELAGSVQSCASVQKERDDAFNEIKRLQQQNDQQVAQHQLDVHMTDFLLFQTLVVLFYLHLLRWVIVHGYIVLVFNQATQANTAWSSLHG